MEINYLFSFLTIQVSSLLNVFYLHCFIRRCFTLCKYRSTSMFCIYCYEQFKLHTAYCFNHIIFVIAKYFFYRVNSFFHNTLPEQENLPKRCYCVSLFLILYLNCQHIFFSFKFLMSAANKIQIFPSL